MPAFKVVSDFEPAGDQPKAIEKLAEGINRGDRFHEPWYHRVGEIGDHAWTIEGVQKPTLVIAPNTAMAAQLASESDQLFPRTGLRTSSSTTSTTPARGVHAADRHLHREGLDLP